MNPYDRIYRMNALFSIWRCNERVRVTFVAPGWLIVWDHRSSPPVRYDCRDDNHAAVCDLAIRKLRDLASA